MEINHLLVLDSDDGSRPALETGWFLARQFDARVTVARLILEHPIDDHTQLSFADYQLQRRQMETAARQALEPAVGEGRDLGIYVESEVLLGDSLEPLLVDYLERHEVDLIVAGCRRGTDFAAGWEADVVECSPVPVLLAPQACRETDPPRIIVPVDFSMYAHLALDYALCMADRCATRLTFLHVIEPELPFGTGGTFLPDAAEGDLEGLIHAQLREFVSDVVGEEHIEALIVRKGRPDREILDVVRSLERGLVIMPSHGAGGLDFVRLGRTADAVMRHSPVPILTLKSLGWGI